MSDKPLARARAAGTDCGFEIVVSVYPAGDGIRVEVDSGCPNLGALRERLGKLNPMDAACLPPEKNPITSLFFRMVPHPGCICLVALIQAVAVSQGMALPQEISISVTKDG